MILVFFILIKLNFNEVVWKLFGIRKFVLLVFFDLGYEG